MVMLNYVRIGSITQKAKIVRGHERQYTKCLDLEEIIIRNFDLESSSLYRFFQIMLWGNSLQQE